MKILRNRYDFVYLFEVINGNPNGDPDAGNLPRLDPETNQGLVSDVCLKRKIRNYVALTKGAETGYKIYVAERAILNHQHELAWKEKLPKVAASRRKKLPRKEEEARMLTEYMCEHFYDIRSFGAVMNTEVNCGQVRGPVQFSFSRSVDPISPLEVSITRMAVTKESDADKERTMGRKYIVPYGLYRAHGYVSACLADNTKNGTGFSEADLELLWEALERMFDHDRSAARGEMAARRLILFRHDTALGNASAHQLFGRITIDRVKNDSVDSSPARSYEDYKVHVNEEHLPEGVHIIHKL